METTIILSTSLIHEIFEYIDNDYKLLIHREGSSDEERSKILSIDLIMRSGLEEYFKDVLLCDRLIHKLCSEAARRSYVDMLIWAREHGCDWSSNTCTFAAKLNLQVKRLIYLQEVPYTPPSTLGATGLV